MKAVYRTLAVAAGMLAFGWLAAGFLTAWSSESGCAGSASAWIEFAVAAVGSALLLGLGYALWIHDERSRRVTVGAIGGPVCFLLWEAIVRSCNGGL